MQTTCYAGLKSNENTVQNRLGMYLSYTCHELLYTCHSAVYPDMQQLYFESIFPYLWGSLGCLDLIGGTSQTHCMIFRSRNLINHCSDSELRIMGIYRYISRMKHHIPRIYQYILDTYTLNALFTLNQALSALRRRRFSAARSLLSSFAVTCLSNVFSTLRPPRRGLPGIMSTVSCTKKHSISGIYHHMTIILCSILSISQYNTVYPKD
jgi:hypothetical protein